VGSVIGVVEYAIAGRRAGTFKHVVTKGSVFEERD